MPGIGSIHAQQVALREDAASDRRRHDLGNWPERRFQPLIGELDGDRFIDRRHNHEFAAALQAIREAEREPLVRCIREMGDEIRRLRRLVEEQGELLDKADHASIPPRGEEVRP